jgi:transposase
MTRTSLDDAQWTSLMMVIQRIPHVWKRDEAALRRFVEAVLWILRTGAPWRDLPEILGQWPSVYHRWRRWCVRGWCNLIFEHLRPMVPADGLVLADSTTCKSLFGIILLPGLACAPSAGSKPATETHVLFG